MIYSALAGLCCLNRFQFRLFLYICSIPSLVLFVGRLLYRYESPRYLVAKGRLQEARNVLIEMAQINGISLEDDFILVLEKQEQTDENNSQFESKYVSRGMAEHRLKVVLASVSFFCQTSAYYGLTLWMSQFLRPWGISASLMLLLVGIAEIPGLFMTSMLLSMRSGLISSKSLLACNFGLCALLSVFIYFVEGKGMFAVAFCLLYFFIVSSWTIL